MSNFYDYTITSDYGKRIDPFTGKESTHRGIDYALPLNTEVKANVSGTVEKANYSTSYGNYVVIKDNSGKLHYYAHLNSASVNMGDFVSVGETIGKSGSTGRSTGAHLHYEVRNTDGSTVDPIYYTDNLSEDSIIFYESDSEKTEVEKVNNDNGNENKLTVIGSIFKYLIMILLIILMVYFIYQSINQ